MKKLKVKTLLEGQTILQAASTVVEETTCLDDVQILGAATKVNNLAVVTKALEEVKSSIATLQATLETASSEQTTAGNNASAKAEEILRDNAEYQALVAVLTQKTARVETLLSDIETLTSNKKSLLSTQKIYLSDPGLSRYIDSESKVGVDFSDVGGARQVLVTKEVGVSYDLSTSVYDFIMAHPEFKNYLNISFPVSFTDASEATSFEACVNSGVIVKNVQKTAKFSTTSSNVNGFNWLSADVEDN